MITKRFLSIWSFLTHINCYNTYSKPSHIRAHMCCICQNSQRSGQQSSEYLTNHENQANTQHNFELSDCFTPYFQFPFKFQIILKQTYIIWFIIYFTPNIITTITSIFVGVIIIIAIKSMTRMFIRVGCTTIRTVLIITFIHHFIFDYFHIYLSMILQIYHFLFTLTCILIW